MHNQRPSACGVIGCGAAAGFVLFEGAFSGRVNGRLYHFGPTQMPSCAFLVGREAELPSLGLSLCQVEAPMHATCAQALEVCLAWAFGLFD